MIAGVFLLVACAGFMTLAAREMPRWRRYQMWVGVLALALATVVLVLEFAD